MKNKIVLPLFLGLVLAGCTRTKTDSSQLSSNAPSALTAASNPTPTSPAPADLASATTAEAEPAIADRIAEWRLSADDIQSEFKESGQIIRIKKTIAAGEPTGPMDGILVAQIKDKLQAEQGTAAMTIKVEVDHGTVMLTGSAKSLQHIGTAVAVSHDTPGVKRTISQIKLASTR
jgi:hypothetical protein